MAPKRVPGEPFEPCILQLGSRYPPGVGAPRGACWCLFGAFLMPFWTYSSSVWSRCSSFFFDFSPSVSKLDGSSPVDENEFAYHSLPSFCYYLCFRRQEGGERREDRGGRERERERGLKKNPHSEAKTKTQDTSSRPHRKTKQAHLT